MKPIDYAKHVIANYGAFEPDLVALAKLAIEQLDELIDASTSGDAYRDGYKDGFRARPNESYEADDYKADLILAIRHAEQKPEDNETAIALHRVSRALLYELGLLKECG